MHSRGRFPPGSSERLLAALRNCSPFLIYQLSWGLERIWEGPCRGVPFAAWPSVSALLLETAERNSALGAWVIVPFVTTTDEVLNRHDDEETARSRIVHESVVSFDESAARELFGSDFGRLMTILASAVPPSESEGRFITQFKVAQDSARSYLRERDCRSELSGEQ
jgi:hypothetical protein